MSSSLLPVSLSGATALVTGANRGIGRALVEALIARGAAKVYATARDTAKLDHLVAAHPDRVVPLALDVTRPDQVARAAEQAADATVVINNAGAVANDSLFAESLDGARQEFEVNYWGPLHMLRAFAPQLKRAPNTALVTVSSVAGLTTFPMLPTYSDSKAAVHSLTATARLLLRPEGVLVTGVYPGPVDTDMAKGLDWPKASTADVAATVLDGIERGDEEIFTDDFAVTYAEPYAAGHKILEHRVAEIMAQQPA